MECETVREIQPMTWRGIAVTFGVGTAIIAWHANKKEDALKKRVTSIGTPSLGGDFTLQGYVGGKEVDVSTIDFRGKWILLYFGFVQCPDICPTEMTKLANVLDTLKRHGKNIDQELVPIFVSVDPDRDTPAIAGEYGKKFHENIVGLSGSPTMVEKAANAFRVYYSKSGKEDDYLVDHSIITYLVDPNGKFSEYFGINVMAPEMAAKIEEKMSSWAPN